MSSNIRISKKCLFCKTEFIAKTTVTKYCSHKCASRAYKARQREAKIQKATQEIVPEIKTNLKNKEYFSIKETCLFIGISRWTLYRLIKNNKLPFKKIGTRTVIKKSDIEKFMK